MLLFVCAGGLSADDRETGLIHTVGFTSQATVSFLDLVSTLNGEAPSNARPNRTSNKGSNFDT